MGISSQQASVGGPRGSEGSLPPAAPFDGLSPLRRKGKGGEVPSFTAAFLLDRLRGVWPVSSNSARANGTAAAGRPRCLPSSPLDLDPGPGVLSRIRIRCGGGRERRRLVLQPMALTTTATMRTAIGSVPININTRRAHADGGWVFLTAVPDFNGMNECCQTGLNCRPLHYQWSALPLS